MLRKLKTVSLVIVLTGFVVFSRKTFKSSSRLIRKVRNAYTSASRFRIGVETFDYGAS